MPGIPVQASTAAYPGLSRQASVPKHLQLSRGPVGHSDAHPACRIASRGSTRRSVSCKGAVERIAAISINFHGTRRERPC